MSKLIESNIFESAQYQWNKVPIKINYNNYIKIVDKLSLLTQYDKISYSVYPPNESDIYIMEYSIMQGLKRWWYADNRWKTFELMELLMFNAVLYDSFDFKCYDRTMDVCMNLKKPYESSEEFCKKYDELFAFISKHYLRQIESNLNNSNINNSPDNNLANNNPLENLNNNNLQFFLGSSKENSVDAVSPDAKQPGNENKNQSSFDKTNFNPIYSNDTKCSPVISKTIYDVGIISPRPIPVQKIDNTILTMLGVAKHPSCVLPDVKQTCYKNDINVHHSKPIHINNENEIMLKKSNHRSRNYYKKIKRKKRRNRLLF